MDELLARLPALLLASSRVAGVTAVSPVFNNRFITPQMRVAFTFLLAFLILPGVPLPPSMNTVSGLLAGVVLELIVGLVIGFMNQLVFAAIQMSGSWLDLDMGFSMAQVFDPVTGFVEPIIGTMFQTLGIVMYLAMGAHQWLIRALVESYKAIPAGGLNLSSDGPLRIVYLFSTMLTLAIQMVMPFIAVMLMLSVALAGINRAMPAFNVFSLGMGLKAVGGMVMLVVMMPFFLGFLEALFQGGHTTLMQTLQMFGAGP